jgi:cytochrome c553
MHGSLAQWLERLFSKEKVGGSSPPWASFCGSCHKVRAEGIEPNNELQDRHKTRLQEQLPQ